MNAGWLTLLVLALVYAIAMTIWNALLMRLLDIAKADVRRLAGDRQPVRQAVAVVETIRRPNRPRIPTQRKGADR